MSAIPEEKYVGKWRRTCGGPQEWETITLDLYVDTKGEYEKV
jgi:hypothetical protein